MLIYAMIVSVDGFIVDREGCCEWTAPNEEQFRFHTAQMTRRERLKSVRRAASQRDDQPSTRGMVYEWTQANSRLSRRRGSEPPVHCEQRR
jgi:hypothetical protein